MSSCPLISCVMATQRNRYQMFTESVQDFLAQTWPAKELVIVSSDHPDEVSNNRLYVEQLHNPSVHWHQLPMLAGSQQPLGAMRNRSEELAHGAYICLWDDDDRHHPERLQAHYEAISQQQADASFLWEQLHYFPAQKAIFWLNWKPNTVPGILCYRPTGLRHVEQGPKAYCGEDREFFNAYQHLGGKIVGVEGRPELYLRIYHGTNNTNFDHHWRLACSRGRDSDLLKANRERICNAIRHYCLPAPLQVRSRQGVSFEFAG